MSHFAEIVNGKVVRVIVAEQDFIDTQDGEWVQTSYNTRHGKHLRGKSPLRKNFAGVGYTYDKLKDQFVPPRPYSSWTKFNDETATWESNMKKPNNNSIWDDNIEKWVNKHS